MAAHFVVVPQWQGSGAERAMRLVDGAEAIRGDLPASATTLVEVPLEAGDAEQTGVHRWSSLRIVRERQTAALAAIGSPAITIGGDCGVELAAVEHVARAGRTVLVWADAHADLNTPTSSPSGAFHGMVLRSIIDHGIVAPADVLLVGTRDLDPAEEHAVESLGIALVAIGEVGAAVAERAAEGATELYVHVDLDVIDPSEFAGVGFPTPFGTTITELVGAIGAARAALPLSGAGVTEFAPASAAAAGDDLPSILRVISALTRPEPAPAAAADAPSAG
ncbi:arginase family protein [Yonghaparkia sp. Soil809]|uniref:arginase family protein n=1 Tax=Yonghaparkia sp. Soil809 TaxID=1736417 RepID=UPI0006FCEABD|nr:arginase family protein [Yonghaparkia sp. Soil809]KRF31006.1 arginase [Yonghaparkia sp. Soil809]